MLDEVDKLGRDYRGDPAAALLEILDPAQNNTFRDNYLDLPFDLSKVLFITTANALDTIPRPLLDRMEMLRLSGYSEEEKVQIAARYLVPRQLSGTGLTAEQLTIPHGDAARGSSAAIRARRACANWRRQLGRVARKVARAVRRGKRRSRSPCSPADLRGPAGAGAHPSRSISQGAGAGRIDGAGLDRGGRRRAVHRGEPAAGRPRRLRLTGQLGDVMRESAEGGADVRLVACRATGHRPGRCSAQAGVHIHVPAGAVPEGRPVGRRGDGDGADLALHGVPVRSDTAMTGEVTLTGLVLPVGGIKEKVLAARRAGMRQ